MTHQSRFDPGSDANRLERDLNDLTRREARHSDPDLVQFATRLHTASQTHLTSARKADIWSDIVASSATTSKIKRQLPTWIPATRDRRSTGVIPQGLPAPAVLFFGVMIALIVALTGFGNDGSDMVTPTVHAEQAATAIASPASPQPTSTLAITESGQ
jgi:hypothetical protein